MAAKRKVCPSWSVLKTTSAFIISLFISASSTGSAREPPDLVSLIGASETDILNQLGPPSIVEKFVLQGNLREFRIELFNHFTSEEVAAENIILRELTWVYRNQQSMTLWLSCSEEAWKVVHGLIWHQNTDF